MTKARLLVMALVLLTLLSSFIKNLTGTVGIPNVMPAIRDPLLIGLAFYGIGRLNFFASRKWALLLGSVLAFALPYIFIAMFEDRAIVGLYYLRLYILPFLFFVGALGIMEGAFQPELRRGLLRFFIYWNNVLLIVALAIYALLQTTPSIRTSLFGPDLLPSAWYISGGTWMRMGLPMSGPNTLGLVFALNAFFFIAILLTQRPWLQATSVPPGKILLSALLAIAGLMLSFSRSSMLILIVAIPLVLLLPGILNFQKLLKVVFIALVMVAILLMLGLVVDEASNGFITRWIELNTSFKDPSMLGHFRSIEDAIDKLHEYMLWGYNKGTVGPKAIIFTGVANHVENSFLAIFYDMGIIFGTVYWIAVATLFATGYRHRLQLILLFGFFPACFLLPYVFESDALIYFAFVYLALGTVAVTSTALTGSTRLTPLHPSQGVV
jgi:hypothetical protein